MTFYRLISLSILLSSCITYGNYTKSELISITEYQCDQKSDTLNVFFKGEKINFEYERIGLVKVEGKRSKSDDDVLNHLKYQAWRNCADAIIHISIGSKMREEGIVMFPDDHNGKYSSTVFTGLAVRIIQDSTFAHSKYPYTTKDSFVPKVKSEFKSNSDQSSFEFAITLLGLAALAVYGATQL